MQPVEKVWRLFTPSSLAHVSRFLPATVLLKPQGQLPNPPFHLISLGLFLSPHPIVMPVPSPLILSFLQSLSPFLQETSSLSARVSLQSWLPEGNKCFRFMWLVWFINVQEEPSTGSVTTHSGVSQLYVRQHNWHAYFIKNHHLLLTELG